MSRGPQATTGRKINVRVQLGSALERMLEGRSDTEALHQMAALFEQALAENWGPPAVQEVMPEPYVTRALNLGREAVERHTHRVIGVDMGAPGGDQGATLVMIGHGRDRRYVTEAEALALAAEQSPGGLVPVGIDTGDDDEVGTTVQKVDDIDEELAAIL